MTVVDMINSLSRLLGVSQAEGLEGRTRYREKEERPKEIEEVQRGVCL
jgi:hypothetical protein